jgi:hypothetical protein
VQPIFDPEPSGSFTQAGIPSDDFELPPRTRNDVVHPADPRGLASRTREPAILRGLPDHPSLHASPVEDHELEHALEALDVDLDDLSIPHAATQLQRLTSPERSRTIPLTRPAPPSPPRAQSHDDDEVIIDFDDD